MLDIRIKHTDGDRLPLLFDKCDKSKINSPYIYIENPIIKGVANQLRKWPSDLFVSYLIACLVISGTIFLVLITVMFCSTVTSDNNDWRSEKYRNRHFFNVYFVKEDAQTWSKKELCCIEATARENPELNIHVINLLRTSTALNISRSYLETVLLKENVNIRINDFRIDEFYNRTQFSIIAKNLTSELTVLAAKTYLLWNSPGIAMNPRECCNLSVINKVLCKEGRKDTPNKFATIDFSIDLQATEVHCQAFIGFLLGEIFNNTTQIYSVKDTLNKFCPRIKNCSEVQVLNLKSKCSFDIPDCPSIRSTEHLRDFII